MRNDTPYIYTQTYGWSEANPHVRTVTTTTSDWYNKYVEFTPYRAALYNTYTGGTDFQYAIKNGVLHVVDKEIPAMPNVDDLL